MALVPRPGDQWPVVAAPLLDGVDLILLGPDLRAKGSQARLLSARARERGVVMVLLDSHWPESPDIRLEVSGCVWEGLGHGHGRLVARRVEVASMGRCAAAMERRLSIWLPSPEGDVRACDPAGPVLQGAHGFDGGSCAHVAKSLGATPVAG